MKLIRFRSLRDLDDLLDSAEPPGLMANYIAHADPMASRGQGDPSRDAGAGWVRVPTGSTRIVKRRRRWF